MSQQPLPEHYLLTRKRHDKFVKALEALGEAVRQEGPLDDKTAHLVQLAAAVAIRSEGAVHSHVRRAIQAGAKPEEVYHAIILVTSTVGYPNVAAALSWADDVIGAGKSTGMPSVEGSGQGIALQIAPVSVCATCTHRIRNALIPAVLSVRWPP